MLGEWGVIDTAGQWLAFRVSESYARTLISKQPAGCKLTKNTTEKNLPAYEVAYVKEAR